MLKTVIPIDDAIRDFKNHLLSHDRTILSARYGDGKTYFLSKFINSPITKRRFTFLTIYPVNYQVLPNKDIFDLVKRDILLQMISQNMLDTYDISDDVAAAFFLQNKFSTVAETFLPLIQMLDSSPKVGKALVAGMSTIKMFKTLRNKYNEWKKDFDTAQKIEDFIIENGKSIYENDAITKIIHDGIENYKKDNPRKRVVLIIEDLDRIDPAHLFRILNVFSAHIDYGYRLGIGVNQKYIVGNKFGLDNVVMVMDYNNTKNIFKHFYGEYANFNGYIDKFCSNIYFTYSLADQKYKYMKKCIAEVTSLPDMIVEPFFRKDKVGICSIRDISKCFIDIEKDLLVSENVFHPINKGFLKLLVIVRRFGMKDPDILKILTSLTANQLDLLMKYVGAFFSIISNKGKLGSFGFIVGERYYTFNNIKLNDDGTLSFLRYSTSTRERQKSITMSSLLTLIAK